MLNSCPVSETDTQIEQSPKLRLAGRIWWTILIAATLYVCYFSHLGAIGFVGPDEPRYAWIARAIAETGDWVTPRLYGKPWFEKPVLYYWGAAASFKLFGVSEAAARLPSALSALLATLALAWLAWRIYGGETARWFLLLLPTSVGMIGFSHAAATDMPFSGMLCIAMVCAAVVIGLGRSDESSAAEKKTPWLALVLFGFFLGAAVLAKGPAAIVLSGGGVFFWALFTKRWRDSFRLFHPVAVAAFLATALPWYVLCALRNPDFFRVFIIEHNFKRYLTPEFQHIQPFWFYLPVVLVAFLPWIGIVLWSLATGTARVLKEKRLSHPMVFFLTWAGFCFVFFSISKSKLPGYVLPAVPAIGLFLARSTASLEKEKTRALGATSAIFAALFFAGAETLASARFHFNSPGLSIQEHLVFVLSMLGIANAVFPCSIFLVSHKEFRTISASLCVLPILFILSRTDLPRAAASGISSRDLATELQAQHVPVDHTFTYRGMNRGYHYGLNYYLGKEIPEWDLRADREAFVVSGTASCKQFDEMGFECKNVQMGSGASTWFVSHITPKESENRTTDGGKPAQKE
jgi:4-amino-4-deoxy-L-arabinose transferase-like glycosyltransferase